MIQPLIGVCGLACALCPTHYLPAEAPCPGCPPDTATKTRCELLSCPHRGPSVRFCWECPQGDSCEIWRKHREFPGAFGHRQPLENNIRLIRCYGITAFQKAVAMRERILREMLAQYDDGNSTPYLCTAAGRLEIAELEAALTLAWETSAGMGHSERAAVLRMLLERME